MRPRDGARAWVCGASSGIGAALAHELAARGCRVAASARRADRLDELAGSARGEVVPLAVDVTDRDAMMAAEEEIRGRFGAIDLAVLNAAYWGRFSVDAWDTEVIRRHFDTNVIGMAHGVEAVLADMRRRRSGAIAGMASLAGCRGLPRSEAYGATKAAEINMLESLRIDLRPSGIAVHTICPGFVRTDLTARNAFRMPFLLEADDAARRIVRGLERGRAEIAFPLPMLLLMKTARIVPVRLWAEAFRLAPPRT
ncbi:MAG TPA: SDR family NAD(P)-dependent oxidoreductase [Gaiellales bacterium]